MSEEKFNFSYESYMSILFRDFTKIQNDLVDKINKVLNETKKVKIE